MAATGTVLRGGMAGFLQAVSCPDQERILLVISSVQTWQ